MLDDGWEEDGDYTDPDNYEILMKFNLDELQKSSEIQLSASR